MDAGESDGEEGVSIPIIVEGLGAVTVTDQDVANWTDFLKDFPGAYKAFMDNRSGLLKQADYIRSQPADIQQAYAELVARADAIAPKLAELKGVYDSVSGFFSKIGSGVSSVYQSAVDSTSQAIEAAAGWIASARRALGLGELGIAPIVIAVGAAAALAVLGAVTKWVADAFMFSKRLDAMRELQNRGYSPSEAADAVNSVLGKPGDKPGTIEKAVTSLLWVAGIGVTLWLFGPKIRAALSGGRRN